MSVCIFLTFRVLNFLKVNFPSGFPGDLSPDVTHGKPDLMRARDDVRINSIFSHFCIFGIFSSRLMRFLSFLGLALPFCGFYSIKVPSYSISFK